MIEPEHDFKEKPKHRGRTSPVDFVVPLQLEECIYRLENQRLPIELRLQILPATDTDQPRFTAILFEEKDVSVEVEGTLQRWEGTSTRFQGKGYFPGYDVLGLGCMANVALTLLACAGSSGMLQTYGRQQNLAYGDQTALLMIAAFLTGIYFLVSTPAIFQIDHYQRKKHLIRVIKGFLEA